MYDTQWHVSCTGTCAKAGQYLPYVNKPYGTVYAKDFRQDQHVCYYVIKVGLCSLT